MDLSTFLTIAGTIFGIVSTLLVGAVWVMSLISKVSGRTVNIERDVGDLEKRVDKLESETSFSSLKETFSQIVLQIFHSKEFKDTNKEVIRDTLLHIEKNRTASEAGALHLILEEIQHIKNEK